MNKLNKPAGSLFTIAEAARELHVSHATIKAFLKRFGRNPCTNGV